jgi:adenosylcobyric acid synthase
MTARALFVGGTSSNAGKSFMTTAICAWLRNQGIAVAPFKAQNMSNNSFPCIDGGEIGRAQVVQAQACGLQPMSAMNPILLKPNGDGTSQVVVRGRVWKTLSARRYYEHFEELRQEVENAYEELARRFDVVVIEGAGSVSELNLRDHDLVNLGLATRIGAPWVLVADIERGGVFASVIGTVSLLTPVERGLFRGFLVNKFRGDMSLFESGAALLESKTGFPCLGVFPFASDLRIDAEDSLALDFRPMASAPRGARIAIVHFPSISNATDFRLLRWAEWIDAPASGKFDFVILPGSKQTLADLAWLRERRLDSWILDQHSQGSTVIGICGGFQMLGESIADPESVESPHTAARGLGLLRADTRLLSSKTTCVRRAKTARGTAFDAYEIHLGVTRSNQGAQPFAWLEDGTPEGMCGERVMGTYLHGALEHAAVCSEVFGVPVTPEGDRLHEYAGLGTWFGEHCRQPSFWQ